MPSPILCSPTQISQSTCDGPCLAQCCAEWAFTKRGSLDPCHSGPGTILFSQQFYLLSAGCFSFLISHLSEMQQDFSPLLQFDFLFQPYLNVVCDPYRRGDCHRTLKWVVLMKPPGYWVMSWRIPPYPAMRGSGGVDLTPKTSCGNCREKVGIVGRKKTKNN